MMAERVYHERQRWQMCGLHALNNVFQGEVEEFTNKELEKIASDLSPDAFISPHKSVLGTGNYDVNVLVKAVESRGCELQWFDRRKDVSEIDFDKIVGLIVNHETLKFFFDLFGLLKSHHWFAVRKLKDGLIYNLNSSLKSPVSFADSAAVATFLAEILEQNGQILVVKRASGSI